MHNDKHDIGFLAGRFLNCPACGELIRNDSTSCRFCGAVLQQSESGELETATVEAPAEVVDHPLIQEFPYNDKGEPIPPEYGPGFNSRAFSWPAFLFADLWYAEKGLGKLATKHFLARMATALVAIPAVITSCAAFTSEEIEPVGDTMLAIGSALLSMTWLLALIAVAALSYMDAGKAYKEYTTHIDEVLPSQGDLQQDRKRGNALYWRMLLVPFGVYLLGFLFMLSASSG